MEDSNYEDVMNELKNADEKARNILSFAQKPALDFLATGESNNINNLTQEPLQKTEVPGDIVPVNSAKDDKPFSAPRPVGTPGINLEKAGQVSPGQSKETNTPIISKESPLQPAPIEETKKSSSQTAPALNTEEREAWWKAKEQSLFAATENMKPAPSIEEPPSQQLPKSQQVTKNQEAGKLPTVQSTTGKIVVSEQSAPVQPPVSDSSKPNDKKNISEKVKDSDKAFATALNNTAQKSADKKTEKQSTDNKYTLGQGPEWETPDWAKSLIASKPSQSDQPPVQLVTQNTIKNQEEISSIQKPAAPSIGLDPRLERLVRTSLMKGASESGVNINYEALLKRINDKLLISQAGNMPQPSEERPLPVGQSPISEQIATAPGQAINNTVNIGRSAAKLQSQSTMSGATERALLSMNKSMDKLSANMQQTNQTLLKSLQTLNNTAIEILKIIPSQGLNASAQPGGTPQQNRGGFKPTESISQINTFRSELGLTPSTYVRNNMFSSKNVANA